MRVRVFASLCAVSTIVAAAVLFTLGPAALIGHAQAAQGRPANNANQPAQIKTAWGEPDLQGIWTYEYDTPLQRPAKYANQEFFTPEQAAELDKERAKLESRDK